MCTPAEEADPSHFPTVVHSENSSYRSPLLASLATGPTVMTQVSPPCLASYLFRADWAVGTFVLQPLGQSVLMSFSSPDFTLQTEKSPFHLSFTLNQHRLFIMHQTLSWAQGIHFFIHSEDIYLASAVCQAMYKALPIELSMTQKIVPPHGA